MNKKAQQMTLETIITIVLGIAVLIFLIYGFSTGWGNVYCSIMTCPELVVNEETCSDSSILKIELDAYDRYEVSGAVEDYYVDEKKLSTYYWDSICEDLLEIELEEDLNKSKNLRLSAGGQLSKMYIDNKERETLYCEFHMFWDGEGDSYMNELDYGFRYFELIDILPAKEKRPAKYNESLISAEWREDFKGTRIRNDNRDYKVKVNLLLNESEWRCY